MEIIFFSLCVLFNRIKDIFYFTFHFISMPPEHHQLKKTPHLIVYFASGFYYPLCHESQYIFSLFYKNDKFTVRSVLITGCWMPDSAVFVCAGNICTVWETTKYCIPARKSGKSQNSREALRVIVGIEVVDAWTVGRPQLDSTGQGFV